MIYKAISKPNTNLNKCESVAPFITQMELIQTFWDILNWEVVTESPL